MMKRVVVLVLLLCLASSALGTGTRFTNAGGDNMWPNSLNWDNGIPDFLTNATIGGGTDPIIPNGYSASARGIMPDAGGISSVNIQTGGYLHLPNYYYGQGASTHSTMNVDAGGEMEVDGAWGVAMEIGNGTTGACTSILNVGGLVWSPSNGDDTINVGFNGATGQVNIGTAGVLLGGDIDLGADGSLDLAGDGRLELWGNHMADLQPGGILFDYIMLSKMTANGLHDPSAFICWHDSVADKTIIKVPEPATIALLGLGGLALIRRKR